MNESSFQTLFGHWLKANWKKSSAFELKIVKLSRFYFSKIESHQIQNLTQVSGGVFYHKIADLGNQNPFDCYTLYKVQAYIVVLFYKPRQPKVFYMININTIMEEALNGKKSITEAEACALASHSGMLK